MAPKQAPIILPTGCTPTSLTPIQQLLHLTAHRNKNQHRIAKWWASFSILRRQLGKLVAALEDPDAGFRANKIEIEKRVLFLREEIVPRCYLAFSTVVADNQYASLGLMLMGCLARLNKLISLPREREEDEGDKVARVEKTPSRNVFYGEDLGEAVSREEMDESVNKYTESLTTLKKGKRKVDTLSGSGTTSSFDPSLLSVSTTSNKAITETISISKEEETFKAMKTTVSTMSSKTTTLKPPKKRRKKGGDEFDELFSGLI